MSSSTRRLFRRRPARPARPAQHVYDGADEPHGVDAPDRQRFCPACSSVARARFVNNGSIGCYRTSPLRAPTSRPRPACSRSPTPCAARWRRNGVTALLVINARPSRPRCHEKTEQTVGQYINLGGWTGDPADWAQQMVAACGTTPPSVAGRDPGDCRGMARYLPGIFDLLVPRLFQSIAPGARVHPARPGAAGTAPRERYTTDETRTD